MPNLGRISEPLKALVDALVGRKLDYAVLYPCSVVEQSGDTLTLLPDDERVRGFGLAGVPIKTGAPGYQFSVPTGARVLLGFEGADPTRPYCSLWESATGVTTVTFDGGSEDIARTNDSVDAGYLVYATSAGVVQNVAPFPAIQYFPGGLAGSLLADAAKGAIDALGAPNAGTKISMTSGIITSGNSKLKA